MNRFPLLRLLLAATIAVLACLAPLPAHAADDVVKRLSVRYDVHDDATIDVRYELDWNFGERGRHGIDFSILTREPWTADRSKDAVYEITDLQVSSPTGAPATYTERVSGSGSDESLDLRIGDPERTVDGKRHTYVIEYTMTGGLRTFDGQPELHLDVTSWDYPRIDEFDITVTAPGGVTDALCFAGTDDCSAEVAGGEALLSGKRIDPRATITAVASFEPGSIAEAEPNLVDQRLAYPRMVEQEGEFEIGTDGSMSVTLRMLYQLPFDDDSHFFSANLPLRRAISKHDDVVYTIHDLTLVDEDRREEIPVKLDDPSDPDQSEQDGSLTFRHDTDAEYLPLTLSYVVDGAVTSDGSTATFRWPVALESSADVSDQRFTWTLPGEVSLAEVRIITPKRDVVDPLTEDLVVQDDTVTLSTSRVLLDFQWASFQFPATALVDFVNPTAPSLDHERSTTIWKLTLGSAAGLLGMSALGFLLGRARLTPDQRYASTPPGVKGSPALVKSSRRRVNVPVRFEEPDEPSLALAGLLFDRRYRATHLSSTLVSLAGQGAIELSSSPLRAGRIDIARLRPGYERTLATALPNHTRALHAADADALENVVLNEQIRLRKQARYFRPASEVRLRRWAVGLLFLIVPLLTWIPYIMDSAHRSPVVPVFVSIGAFLGAGLYLRFQGPALTAEGTMLRDQLLGLRQYIATAEQHQLRYEESEDIFRRFLPWAVLFGLTDRWTSACRSLAASGQIADIDTSFVGASSVHSLTSTLDSITTGVSMTSSSDGSSGSSSGFSSSGGAGGGGGGGTSASSW